MSDWMIEMSDGSLMGQERRISSAYRMTVEEGEKGNWEMSLTYKMKRLLIILYLYYFCYTIKA